MLCKFELPLRKLCSCCTAWMLEPDRPQRAGLAAPHPLRFRVAAGVAGKGAVLPPSGPKALQDPGCPRRAGPRP